MDKSDSTKGFIGNSVIDTDLVCIYCNLSN